MITEPLIEIISERALTLARALHWVWRSTQRTDSGILLTLSITIPHATPSFLTTQVHRLESILEALGWHLANVSLTSETATVQFEYNLLGPPTGQYPTLEEKEPETQHAE